MTVALVDPTVPLLVLSDDETRLVSLLEQRLTFDRAAMQLTDAYYNGQQAVQNLGIAVPDQLAGLHTVLGWPRLAVDAVEERLDVTGFRYPDAADADADLWSIWQANNMDEEAPLAHLDAFVYGRSYACVGSGDCGGGDGDSPPLITVESPLDMTVEWDPRSRTVLAGFRIYQTATELGETPTADLATLYLPEETLYLERARGSGMWRLLDRDQHRLGVAPVVRLANRQRTRERDGRSEITDEVMSLTDAACRTLLGAEVAREFFAAPRRYALGVSAENFVKADGSTVQPWEAFLSKVWALERDAEGNVPEVGQFPAASPQPFVELIGMYSKLMASITGLPAHYLGYSTDNPTSADAIRSSEARLVKRVQRKQQAFAGAWEDVMRLAVLIQGGSLPPEDMHQLETMWADPATPTPAATTDAMSKQVAAGVVPPTSDVALERLGYSPVERRRIAADRKRDEGTSLLAQLASSLQARDARTDVTVADDSRPPGGSGGDRPR